MNAQIKKGILEMCILHVISGEDLYGYDIIQRLHGFFPEVMESTFYAILRRLHKEGAATTFAGEVSKGPVRKYYKITEQGQQQLEQSIERVIAGPEKKSRAMMSEYEKNLVSYHEAGHALCGYLLPECDPVHKVSIIPRGRAGGYTLLLPTEDRNYMTRTHLRQQIIMMLGGRVAEEIVLHEISTGASNDIERATSTIRRMITEWGMSDELGTITFGNNNNDQVFLGRDLGRDRNYSEAVAYSIDKEVKRLMDECHAEARRLLSENLDKLTIIAETLKDRETIQADEFVALMEGRSLEDLDQKKEELLREQKGLTPQAEKAEETTEETTVPTPFDSVTLQKEEDVPVKEKTEPQEPTE